MLDIWLLFEAFQSRYIARGMILERKKKCLIALAEWAFGGGEDFCRACAQTCPNCPNCPKTLNAPRSIKGWQVWTLVQRLDGQVRVAGGMGGTVLGWDMSAAFHLGAALGIPPLIIAELLPPIEAAMARKINENAGSGDREWLDA